MSGAPLESAPPTGLPARLPPTASNTFRWYIQARHPMLTPHFVVKDTVEDGALHTLLWGGNHVVTKLVLHAL